ncbi:hypothetical protein HGO34_16345 [Agrobacterium vitis]|uniref:Uncharacterized protein n=1 Tax=Agrobacterium vitis TaxID=373 RepID=A0AAE4WDY0_AGRVI|nr:hypothetical protein [Agrobacterium vitis]MCF1498806.1 hypothetical protein [Allorhizobium sp. Av2]MCM2441293.1 hypothetical protein [Agrobacterium vitis]MUZ58324.1 hypothetical protein [Agrobacterium vitis]MVA65983.1 hypothetical protein [Agrobacterium vitis]MVA87995.1 hypothetical protein [Agrobacterium vitis]
MAINQNMVSGDEEQTFSKGLKPGVLIAIIALAVAYLGFFFASPLPASPGTHGAALLHAPQQTQHLAARENGSRAVALASRHDPRVPVPPPLAVLSSGAEHFLFVGRSSAQLVAGSSLFVSGRISRANLARAPPSLSA